MVGPSEGVGIKRRTGMGIKLTQNTINFCVILFDIAKHAQTTDN